MLNESLKNIMTQGYLYVESHQAAGKAMRVMRDMHISCVFVLKDDKPVGAITERKIMEKALKGVNLFNATAEDIMSTPLLQLKVDDTIQDACELMNKEEIRHIGIVDTLGTLKGTITPSNIVNIMGMESFSSNALVKDVMYPHVVFAEESSSLLDAATAILEKRTCCAVVMKNSEVVGIVSEKDAANSLSFGHNIAKVTLDKIMSSPVIGVQDKDSIAQAIITLRRHRIHRVIAYNQVGQVSGILALEGLVRNIDKVLH